MAERRSAVAPEKVDIQMTPMIDIVFQLMAFFLMTFKVAPVEGDFAMKLPRYDYTPNVCGTVDEIVVRLRADALGDLADLRYPADAPTGSRPDAETFRRLRSFVEGRVAAARAAGQEDPEVKIDADDRLRYENIIRTIDTVSATTDEAGRTRPLAKKVGFVQRSR